LFLDNSARQTGPDTAIQVLVHDTVLPAAYEAGLEKFVGYREQQLQAWGGNPPSLDKGKLERGLRLRHHFAARYPDVALVQLRTDTPTIPVQTVDFTPLGKNADVTLVGFGCSGPRHSRDGRSAVRRAGRTRVIRVDAINFYTQGGQRSPGAPSLCPGDSGGPVLGKGGVVGIHTVVYGLSPRHGARSNMAVRLAPLADWDAWPPEVTR